MRRPYTGTAGRRPGRRCAPAGRGGVMSSRLSDAMGWLAGQRAAMESFLERLIAQNSFTGNRRGVEAVANLCAGQLRTLALDVELRASQRFGPHVLFAGKGPGAPVFLLGHT